MQMNTLRNFLDCVGAGEDVRNQSDKRRTRNIVEVGVRVRRFQAKVYRYSFRSPMVSS